MQEAALPLGGRAGAALGLLLVLPAVAGAVGAPVVTAGVGVLTDGSTEPASPVLAAGVTVLCAGVLGCLWLWTVIWVGVGAVEWAGRAVGRGLPVLPWLGPPLVRLAVPVLVATVMAAGTATARAGGDAVQRLSGLSLPDRVLGGPPSRHRVRPGESLWTIADRWLPGRSSVVAVDRAWRRVYRANRVVIGGDPNLIRPGTLLWLTPHPGKPVTDPGGRP